MPAPTLTEVLEEVTNLIAKWTNHEDDYAEWLAGTITGGPNGDGKYPLRNASGTPVLFPCPAKLASDMMRGHDAAQDITLFVQGIMGAGEVLHLYLHGGINTTMDITNSAAGCEVAPLSTSIVTILKNGSPWATVTFAAGSTTGVIACANPNIAKGDLLRWIAPASHDPSFSNFFMTITGA